MGKLNMEGQELRDYIALSASIIEPCIEDVYINKRLLMDVGMPAERVDDFIEELIRQYDSFYQGLDEDEYNECVMQEKERVMEDLSKTPEERIGHIPEKPDLADLCRENMDHMERNIRQIMFMKRGMENMGVDAYGIACAIMDSAREYDEKYSNMPDDEFDKALFDRMLERLLGEPVDEDIDPETAA